MCFCSMQCSHLTNDMGTYRVYKETVHLYVIFILTEAYLLENNLGDKLISFRNIHQPSMDLYFLMFQMVLVILCKKHCIAFPI